MFLVKKPMEFVAIYSWRVVCRSRLKVATSNARHVGIWRLSSLFDRERHRDKKMLKPAFGLRRARKANGTHYSIPCKYKPIVFA
jgi:hypothetical protein